MTIKGSILLLALFLAITAKADSDAVRDYVAKVVGPRPLYEGDIPNSKPAADEEKHQQWLGMELITHVSRPSYTVYLPPRARASGAAVLVFPGGGYSALSWDMEGRWIAESLQDRGIVAVLVKYRLPSSQFMPDKSIAPLQDAQQALRQVRRNAKEWGVDPHKVGAIGFSAGGHLVSMLGTEFATPLVPNPDNLDLRPDFLILVYPVISFAEGRVHAGMRATLIGERPSPQVVTRFSSDLHVNDKTPPTLLIGASNDAAVKYDHLLDFYSALRRHNVLAELVLFERGDHGFFELTRDEWKAPLWAWLERNELIRR